MISRTTRPKTWSFKTSCVCLPDKIYGHTHTTHTNRERKRKRRGRGEKNETDTRAAIAFFFSSPASVTGAPSSHLPQRHLSPASGHRTSSAAELLTCGIVDLGTTAPVCRRYLAFGHCSAERRRFRRLRFCGTVNFSFLPFLPDLDATCRHHHLNAREMCEDINHLAGTFPVPRARTAHLVAFLACACASLRCGGPLLSLPALRNAETPAKPGMFVRVLCVCVTCLTWMRSCLTLAPPSACL